MRNNLTSRIRTNGTRPHSWSLFVPCLYMVIVIKRTILKICTVNIDLTIRTWPVFFISGSHSYTDYVSNWNDISCSIWALLNCALAHFPQAPDFAFSALSAFNAIAPTFSIGVAGAFWCLLPAERQSTDIVSLHQHGFLAVITVADLIFSAAPIRNSFNI